MRTYTVSVVASALLLGGVPVHAQDAHPVTSEESPDAVTGTQADGTLNLAGGTVAAGIGYSWGHGSLNYGGRSHPFKISGISIADVGAANISATGRVYNLRDLGDFNGNYVAMTAGMTVAGGGSATYLKNEHGVVIKLRSSEVGLRFALAADGVKVKLGG